MLSVHEAGEIIGFGILSIWADDLFWIFCRWVRRCMKRRRRQEARELREGEGG